MSSALCLGHAENPMQLALSLAKKAEKLGEIPVGAVIVRGDKVIATGYNRRERSKNGLAHAEIIAINKACKKLKSWRLTDCEMYVTLEPCEMCMGAARNSRLGRVIYGASGTNAGLNHELELVGGMMEDECAGILRRFFKGRREEK
ncbi:tRNA-specific adenosine deaminase [Clostridia bacterium]|nr:tRNA-specific adenosine deaminase [Clostridia bacterium]